MVAPSASTSGSRRTRSSRATPTRSAAARSSSRCSPAWSSTARTPRCSTTWSPSRSRLRTPELDHHAQGRMDLPRRHARHRESFVDAWNWAALRPTAGRSYFFGNIEGYADLNPERTRATRDPRGDERPHGRGRPTFNVALTRAVRAVPADRRLHRVLPAARVVLRRPGRLQRGADRERSLHDGRRVEHDQGINV